MYRTKLLLYMKNAKNKEIERCTGAGMIIKK